MDPSLEDIIVNHCFRFSFDPKWVKAIIQQESQGNTYALRYEPQYAYLYQVKIFAQHALISLATEETSQKMSWGLGQVMGAVAREQGHAGFMGELFQPELNVKHICIRLKNLKHWSLEKDDLFSMYNGGPGTLNHKVNGKYPNQAYVDSVNGYLQTFTKS